MKNMFASVIMIVTVTASCNNNSATTDSVDSANEVNKSLDSNKYGVSNLDSTASDETSLVKAYSGGMLEVMLGNTAQQNGASKQVKDFGKMMIKDHTKADSKMVAIAAAKSIALPSKPSDDEYTHINKLQGEKGKDFDKDYVNMMIDDHKKDISDFQDAAQNSKDADIKVFAMKTLPILQKHLASVQVIDSTMKK